MAPQTAHAAPCGGGAGCTGASMNQRSAVDRIRGGAPDEPTRSPVAGGPGARQPRSSYAYPCNAMHNYA